MSHEYLMKLYAWLEPYWQIIWSAWENHRGAHAWMIVGPHGSGKLQLPIILSRFLLCQNGQVGCGSCRGCLLLKEGTHPDFIHIKLEESAQNIKISQIRSLIQQLELKPHQGGWRVVLIEDADKMNSSSANALLKTLEEPPEDTVLVLLIANESRLPATVASRARRLLIALPEHSVSKQWLLGQGYDEKRVEHALFMAEGAPLIAKEILADSLDEQWKEWHNSLKLLMASKAGVGETAALWNDMGESSLHWFAQIMQRKILLTKPGNARQHKLYQQIQVAINEWHLPLNQTLQLESLLDALKEEATCL